MAASWVGKNEKNRTELRFTLPGPSRAPPAMRTQTNAQGPVKHPYTSNEGDSARRHGGNLRWGLVTFFMMTAKCRPSVSGRPPAAIGGRHHGLSIPAAISGRALRGGRRGSRSRAPPPWFCMGQPLNFLQKSNFFTPCSRPSTGARTYRLRDLLCHDFSPTALFRMRYWGPAGVEPIRSYSQSRSGTF